MSGVGVEGHRISGDTSGIIGAVFEAGDFVKEKGVKEKGTVERLAIYIHTYSSSSSSSSSSRSSVRDPRPQKSIHLDQPVRTATT